MARSASAAQMHPEQRERMHPEQSERIPDALGGDEGHFLIAGDPVSEIFSEQLTDPEVNKPIPAYLAADIGPMTTVFRFRSKPGYRGLGFHIPVPSDEQDPDRKQHEIKVFRRKVKDGQERKRLEDLAIRNGSRNVNFRPVPKKFECVYETDDAGMAAWLRQQLGFGEIFFEDVGPVTVTLPTGQTISVVAATDADRQALAAARVTA